MPSRKIKDPYNFNLCRSCKHYYLSHTDEDFALSFCHNLADRCKCKEFLPKDNLEFLEQMYEKHKSV